MTPNNFKQADFPRGSILLKNPNGTAPGCIVEKGGKAAILLPGPPRELFPMFQNEVMPYLEQRSGCRLYSRELRIFGLGESSVEHRLKDLMDAQDNPPSRPTQKRGKLRCASPRAVRMRKKAWGWSRPLSRKLSAGWEISFTLPRACRSPACAPPLSKQKI